MVDAAKMSNLADFSASCLASGVYLVANFELVVPEGSLAGLRLQGARGDPYSKGVLSPRQMGADVIS